MSYELISYIVYGAISFLAVILAFVIKFLEAKVGKEKLNSTLSEADKYRKAIVDAITSAEGMFPGADTGKQKKVVATLAVDNVVNGLKKFKPTSEQISKDIDQAVAITREVNFPQTAGGKTAEPVETGGKIVA